MLAMQTNNSGSSNNNNNTNSTKSPEEQSHHNSSPIKMERRDSTTSESSLEHLDLGRTPKKLKLSNHTSTPLISATTAALQQRASNGGARNATKAKQQTIDESAEIEGDGEAKTNSTAATTATEEHMELSCNGDSDNIQQTTNTRLHDSDELHDYDDDDEESADEKHQQQQQQQQRQQQKRAANNKPTQSQSQTQSTLRAQRHHHQHKRRSAGGGGGGGGAAAGGVGATRLSLSKRTSVQLEYNADNPNSLRKKFRFNRSGNSSKNNNNNNNNNNNSNNKTTDESGFVDGSGSGSQYLDASTASTTGGPALHHRNSSSSASASASSSPRGAGTGTASSPESGSGERERDMKYVCPICVVVSATPHEFTNHIRCHNYTSGDNENFTCRICSKVLSSASSLDRHVLVHTGERPFNCKYCHLTFTTNGNMHRHMRTHKQHQHNHHRRSSNGTKNHNNNNSNHNNNSQNNKDNNVTKPTTTTTSTTTKSSTATTTTSLSGVSSPAHPSSAHAQLTNGISTEVDEGVKAATASTTTTTTPATIATATKATNDNRLNGNGACGESYESDGGCSTDSSSTISQSSNNNNNNNNNSNKNNNNYIAENNNDNKTTTLNIKRKKGDDSKEKLDVLEAIATLKRRLKTANATNINNNTICMPSANDATATTTAEVEREDRAVAAAAAAPPPGTLVCPVCEAADFDDMLKLGAHFDTQHPDIPAKCRQCDVVFSTHRQLNVHPCQATRKPTAAVLPYMDYNNEKLPELVSDDVDAVPPLLVKRDRRQSETSVAGVDVTEAIDEIELQRQREEFLHKLQLRNAQRAERFQDDSDVDSEDNEERHHRQRPGGGADRDDMDDDDDDDDELKYELEDQHLNDSKADLADIQSILNMTSSSSTSFLKNFEQSVNTPSSNYGLDKDEEEAQDVFTAEFRKMKLRGEFPCKLCSAVFPNLRALKGHNRNHLSAVGPSGPFLCNMCPYSSCDKAALVRHMRTHNGDRPYECAVCNYAFTTKANCERHLRNRHAKTTRDEVKRSIIYHPSEDSSCDDPSKKLQLFSPEFDDDLDTLYQQQQQPKDRSTPVSHLKEMLSAGANEANLSTSPTKPIKIQVKRLDQLIDKNYSDKNDVSPNTTLDTSASSSGVTSQNAVQTPGTAPIDLSMDVLDLSKKTDVKTPAATTVGELPSPHSTASSERNAASGAAVMPPNALMDFAQAAANVTLGLDSDANKFDMAAWAPLLLNEQYPMLHQFCRNLLFPGFNPFMLQNNFLPNKLNDVHKYAPLMDRLFNVPPVFTPPAGVGVNMPDGKAQLPNGQLSNTAAPVLSQMSPLLLEKAQAAAAASHMPSMPKASPSSLSSHGSLSSRHSSAHMPTVLPGGPVKMVIKNGVLMPKQKQRRYRTERPFACEHCSARFTLRSNMERHIKQQHPQFYAQRQRSGHHVMRGRGASSAAAMNNFTHLQAAFGVPPSPASLEAQQQMMSMKALLAQHVKQQRKNTDLLQQALAHGSSSVNHASHLLLGATPPALPQTGLPPSNQHFNFGGVLNNSLGNGSNSACLEDDEPKLVIDEDDDEDEEEEEDLEEIGGGEPDEFDDEPVVLDQPAPKRVRERKNSMSAPSAEQFSTPAPAVTPAESKEPKTKSKPSNEEGNEQAKKVAKTILEQAIKAGGKSAAKNEAPVSSLKSMIDQAGSVAKSLKDVASSQFKDESQDLVSVSKLVDNATNNSVSFNTYFRRSDVANQMEQSDEEGLVASGSASESNNSGTEDATTAAEPKKKSAYSLAPNRVSCPYCQRMFPWSSSLRRHILTHTGQKPFKCSHCPLLFTTKSNCDRHLLRKHGDVESAMSVYVPTEDVNEPIPVPKSVEEIEQQQRQQREDEERRRRAEEAKLERERHEKEQRHKQQQLEEQQQKQDQQKQQLEQGQYLLKLAQINQLAAAAAAAASANSANNNNCSNKSNESTNNNNSITSGLTSDLPYKCHLCESSFGERLQCLEHIKNQHTQEFTLLLAKGAIDLDADPNAQPPPNAADEEDLRRPNANNNNNDESLSAVGRGGSNGKYPDYSNRKVICAFCVRRFWSTEDLRRHMRTHSGERPFQCEICLRKFTLKHSMLRHMKKHSGRHHCGSSSGDANNAANSGSDFSDDEQLPNGSGNDGGSQAANLNNSAMMMAASGGVLSMRKIQELLNKASEWQNSRSVLSPKENINEEHNSQHQHQQSDLIGNLLGISDQGILNKLLSSADEAAKFLGVDK